MLLRAVLHGGGVAGAGGGCRGWLHGGCRGCGGCRGGCMGGLSVPCEESADHTLGGGSRSLSAGVEKRSTGTVSTTILAPSNHRAVRGQAGGVVGGSSQVRQTQLAHTRRVRLPVFWISCLPVFRTSMVTSPLGASRGLPISHFVLRALNEGWLLAGLVHTPTVLGWHRATQ
jgi:hypothetical protein